MEESMEEQVVYFGNVLSAFENGVQLDLRVKLAVDFLKSPSFQVKPMWEHEAAKSALDLADKLLAEALDRGWVRALPDTGEISALLKRHIERSVAAAAHQAQASQRVSTVSLNG
jgi:hypothetical protein